ncbi:hypothetical protein V6N12_014803 [Hibiscus sabdariffa]|uniref:Uncharacterized protein n=1 Tax=Hibiscus sabdariffa TaxID=183260 RepID=A0ABR2DLB2_9ROSI
MINLAGELLLDSHALKMPALMLDEKEQLLRFISSNGLTTKKKLDLSKQGKSSANTYLLTSGKKWSKEFNAMSIDILGAASVIAALADSGIKSIRHLLVGFFWEGVILEHHSIAGICGSLSSEAMNSCITVSADPGESYHRDRKCPKVGSLLERHSTSDVTWNVDKGTCSDESCGEMDPTDWTDEEKYVLIQSDDANGGGSDMEDASVLESSVVCSDKLGSKLEIAMPSHYKFRNVLIAHHCSPIDVVVESRPATGCSTEGFGNDFMAPETSLSKSGGDEHDSKCTAETSSQTLKETNGDFKSLSTSKRGVAELRTSQGSFKIPDLEYFRHRKALQEMRGYGFWDGSRIQTGLSSLPSSAILMAKYPYASVNYPTSSSQMEQQALQTVVHSTDRTFRSLANNLHSL